MAIEGKEVKVIGSWASPFVARATIALNLKGIEYEFLQEDLKNKSELLLKLNPVTKKVPVLVHKEKPVSESLIIVEYIDQVWATPGSPILPADPYDRAIARFWATYVDTTLLTKYEVLLLSEDEKVIEEAKEHVTQALVNLEEAFVKCSEGKRFFGGETIGFVDIAFGSNLKWMKVYDIITGATLFDEKKTPRLVEWAKHFSSVDAVKRALPETEKLVELSKVLRLPRSAATLPTSSN